MADNMTLTLEGVNGETAVLPPPHSCAVEWESDVAYGWTITVLRHPPEPELKFCPSCGEDLTRPPVVLGSVSGHTYVV